MTLSEAEKWHLDYRVQLVRRVAEQHGMYQAWRDAQPVYSAIPSSQYGDSLGALRRRYIRGEIELDEFERGVERILQAEA